MLVIPAVDLKDGRCVRLQQGVLQTETVYSEDAVGTAERWQSLGAPWLHLVDLDGAVVGEPRNLRQIESILRRVTIPVQIGGGLRTLEIIQQYLAFGAARVVLGTLALENPALLVRACEEYPGRIALGIDARGGQVAVRGWTSISATPVHALVHQVASLPLAAIIYTDIACDGMLTGPNLAALHELADSSPFPIVASGGIRSLQDLLAIQSMGPAVAGAIVGKALYEGSIDLPAALSALRQAETRC